MLLRSKPKVSQAGLTLPEVIIAAGILSLVMSGIIYGYVQMNRMAVWSSYSLAGISCAMQGMEQVRGSQWWEATTTDQWQKQNPLTNANGTINIVTQTNTLDVPSSGTLLYVTNYLTVSTWSGTPQLRMIRSDCVWTMSLTGQAYTNTVITIRAPDQ